MGKVITIRRGVFKAARERAGLYQKEIAYRMGISRNYLDRMISGSRRWYKVYAQKLSEILGVAYDQLFEDEGDHDEDES